MTSAYGALSLIKNFQEEQAARLLSSEARDTLRQWHKRRTTNRTIPSVDDFQVCGRQWGQALRLPLTVGACSSGIQGPLSQIIQCKGILCFYYYYYYVTVIIFIIILLYFNYFYYILVLLSIFLSF